jgi:ubiquinone/menaquinone biosynthesis C-methylase UbiE
MPEFAELKQRQAAVWSKGRFEEIAVTLADMHTAMVEAVRPQPGERWLDLACGAGQLAELAAGAGAAVTGIDISPRLIEVAKERAAAGGFEIDYRLGDVEHLDGIEDASYDVVSSSVGVIFAPDQAQAVREIARVTRPGGRLVMTAWTREGSVAPMFEIAARFQPPPPEGAGSPLDWAREERVRELLGGPFELSIERRFSRVEADSFEEAWEQISTRLGPVVMALEMLPPGPREAFERLMVDDLRAKVQPDGRLVDDREYFLVTGAKR